MTTEESEEDDQANEADDEDPTLSLWDEDNNESSDDVWGETPHVWSSNNEAYKKRREELAKKLVDEFVRRISSIG